jgi:SAM-dependent methyltransferase
VRPSKVGELAAWGDADCVAVPRRLPRRGMISCQIARPVQEPEKRAADRRLQREELGNVPGSRRVHGCSWHQHLALRRASHRTGCAGHRARSIRANDRPGPAKPATSPVVFGRASAYELPLPEGCGDLVFMSQIYHHLPDPAAVARECRRVLRAGGYVCIRTGTRENDVVVPGRRAWRARR